MFGWTLGRPKRSLRGLTTVALQKGEFLKLAQDIEKETDMTVAIHVASVLDRFLAYRLHLEFVSMPDTDASELFFGEGPLSSMAARIAIAYAIGITTKDERTDLDRIRQIRNAFAHSAQYLTFSNEIY